MARFMRLDVTIALLNTLQNGIGIANAKGGALA